MFAAIITCAFDAEFISNMFPERYVLNAQDGILNPDHIASAYWMQIQQPPQRLGV
ncbi:MAG: hypothetical protein WCL01_08885 [Comamonadaceae bacterium]